MEIKLKKCPYCTRVEEYEGEFDGNWGNEDCCIDCALKMRDDFLDSASRFALWKHICRYDSLKKEFLDYYLSGLDKYYIAEYLFTNNIPIENPVQTFSETCKENAECLKDFIRAEYSTHEIGLNVKDGSFDR